MHLTASERRELFHFASGYVPVQSSSISAISLTFPLHSSVLAASANPPAVGECSTSSSDQFKPSFFISALANVAEFIGMPSSKYSMATKNLSAPF